jgi:pSer/pThr/pTyr-binding forkhead associated (FHA) protein
VKTTRNPFAGMVTLGRAANNDVCLYSGSVSKVHAYFQQDAERWTVRDGGSANGTFVDGVRLDANVPTPLDDGRVLAFGPDVECVFKLPGPLHDLLLHLVKK